MAETPVSDRFEIDAPDLLGRRPGRLPRVGPGRTQRPPGFPAHQWHVGPALEQATSNRSGRPAAPRARRRRVAWPSQEPRCPPLTIRPEGRDHGDIPPESRRHTVTPCGEICLGFCVSVEAASLESKDVASSIEPAGQCVVAKDTTADRMDKKKRQQAPRSRDGSTRMVRAAGLVLGAEPQDPRLSIPGAVRTTPAMFPTALRSGLPDGPRVASARPGRRSHRSRQSGGSGVALPRSPRAVPRVRREDLHAPWLWRLLGAEILSGPDDRPCPSEFGVRTRRSGSVTGSWGLEASRGDTVGLHRHSACARHRQRCRR